MINWVNYLSCIRQYDLPELLITRHSDGFIHKPATKITVRQDNL